MTSPAPTGDLQLGHLLAAAGIDSNDVLAIRHTVRPKDPRSLRDLSDEGLLEYTRLQKRDTRILPKDPPRLWLVFLAEGRKGTNSRLVAAYDNHGQLPDDGGPYRLYDLRPARLLESLRLRLVVEWLTPVRWAARSDAAARLPVVEIADARSIPFPGYGHVLLSFDELRAVVDAPEYSGWREALTAVQGIYVILDRRTGLHYVGKADGFERLLGRWTTYAADGHGDNVALKALLIADPTHKHDFVYSILRVFDPGAPPVEVNKAEEHYKQALGSRAFGYNRI